MGRQLHKIVVLICVLIIGCVKDKPTELPAKKISSNIFIVCEGSYGSGNASLWGYNVNTNTASGDLFYMSNASSMGDVFQSMSRVGSKYLLCINNSDKIVALDTGTLKIIGTASILKPRYIVPTGASSALVSTLYSNKVEFVDIPSLAHTRSIALPYSNPEGICKIGTKIYVCPWDTLCNHIYEIDETTATISRELNIAGYAPHAVLADKYGMLWILSGNVTRHRQSALTRIDPSTGATLKSYKFVSGEDPIKPAFNVTRDTLYFIQVKYDGSATNNGIYRMSIDDASLPSAPFIQAKEYQYFWALGVEPATGHIYVGDPRGFIQKGVVSVYRPDGTMTSSFEVGIGPGQFYFGN